ncbi:MAG: glutamate mutase L [Anaerolineae bacterium]|nr:glutamate mutase L [Anaerolineae bacterium]
MAEEQPIGSILLADCGTVITRAVLLEQVAGRYRFVAHGEALTTTEYPWADVSEGIRHAAEQIEEVTGRRFFEADGDIILPELSGRRGVDIFAATASASQPLEVVLGGLVRDLSLASIQRAAAGTYSLVKAVICRDSSESVNEENIIRTILETTPDVVCLAGGTEGGASAPVLELVNTVTLACSLMDPGVRPQLLYAGNSRLRRQVAKAVKGQAELRVADNVRPALTVENPFSAQAELDALYIQKKMGLMPGIETVSGWCSTPLTPTASAFSRVIHYLWHLGDPTRGVLGIDVGAANTTVVAVFGGLPFLTIHGGVGSAFGGKELLERKGEEAITRWIPASISGKEVFGILANKEMHPASIYQETRELWVEQAVIREAIRAAMELARPGWRTGEAQPYPHLMPLCETIVLSGGALTHAPRPGHVVLMILDALEPIGIATLVLDVHGMIPALGKVATIKPLAMVEVLDSGALVNLATLIVPVGQARRGDLVLRVNVAYDDGSNYDVDVHYGDLEVLPLLPGQEAVLTLRPERNFDVGLGGPGKSGKRRVSGGLAGLIIDARGRPLRLPRQPELRHAQLRQWLWDVGG